MGFIYIARCGEHYKIGYTQQNVAKRISALQTGNPATITLVGSIIGTIFDEARWHDYFAPKRIRGEWFKLDEDDVKCILEPDTPYAKLVNMLAKATPEMKRQFVKEVKKVRSQYA